MVTIIMDEVDSRGFPVGVEKVVQWVSFRALVKGIGNLELAALKALTTSPRLSKPMAANEVALRWYNCWKFSAKCLTVWFVSRGVKNVEK